LLLGLVWAGLLAIAACSSKAALVGLGGECSLATDCVDGLICAPQPNKPSVCTDDLSTVAGKSPPEAGAAKDAATDARSDGAVKDSGTDAAPPQEAGPPDSGGD
jgi:hypothetical protein